MSEPGRSGDGNPNESFGVLRHVEGAPRLAYESAGVGPPVVFLHGIGGSRQNWRLQAEALSSQFAVHAWDARGYGDSDDYDGPLDFSDFGDDLARLLDHLGADRAHLVGLSMGARILLDFAPRHSDRVATLTLCDCFYGFETALSPEKQREFLELRERPLREGKTFADLAPALIDSLVGPDCSADARGELLASILRLRVDSYLKTLRATVGFDRSTELVELAMPVQLIFGALDRLTPPSIGEAMVALLPSARLAVLPGAGHLSNLEAPEAFNEVLSAFLAEHAHDARFTSDTNA